VFNI